MDRTFEYTVIAYLDGQLDPREERAFLRAVSADPKKQAILRQHRRLNDVLRDKKTPIAVPLRTQQALAQKLPALTSVVPKTLPTAAASAGGALAGMSAGKILGIIIAGTAFLGMFTAYMFTRGPETDRMTSDEVLQHTPARMEQRQKELAASEKIQDSRRAASSSDARTAVGSAQAADNADRASDEAAARNQAPAAVTPRETAGRRDVSAAAKRTSSPGAARKTELQVIPDDLPLAAPFLAPQSESAGTASERNWRSRQSPSQALRDLLGGNLHAYLETGAARYDMRGSRSASNSVTKGVYLAGLRYDLSSSFAIGMEVGQSTFAREGFSTERLPLAAGSSTQIVVVNNALLNETQPWLRAHMLWTINPQDRLRLQADAGSGLLLSGDTPVIFSLGVSTVYALTHVIQARAGLHYSGTWLSPNGSPPEISSDGGVIGIMYNATDAGTVYSSAIEFRVGFGVLIW